MSDLAGRPVERPTADHMHVKVKDGLPSTSTAIDHRRQSSSPSCFATYASSMAQQGGVSPPQTSNFQAARGESRAHAPGLRSDVAKGEALRVAVDLITGNLATQDAGKDRVFCHGARGVTGGASTVIHP